MEVKKLIDLDPESWIYKVCSDIQPYRHIENLPSSWTMFRSYDHPSWKVLEFKIPFLDKEKLEQGKPKSFGKGIFMS